MADKIIKDKEGKIDLKIMVKDGLNEVRVVNDSYIKIPPELVDVLTIEYVDDWGINRFIKPCNEQTDGTFLLGEYQYNIIADDNEIKKLKLDEKPKITKSESDSKYKD